MNGNHVEHLFILLLLGGVIAGTGLAQEEPADSIIGTIVGSYDANRVVVDVGFRAVPKFDESWDYQLFIDADNDPTTGYARGFDVVVRGLGSLSTPAAVHRTTGGDGPAGWGAKVGEASAQLIDAYHLRITLPFGASGLTQGAVRYTFEVYELGSLTGTARDRSTESGDGYVDTDCNLNGVADDRDIANGTSRDCSGNGIPDECEPDCNGNTVADSCEIANNPALDCDGNGVLGPCEAFAQATGPRYITIKPTEGLAPVALLVRGDPEDSRVACVSRYVRADGTLSPTAHFATPGDWCKVNVRGPEILPGYSYRVFEDRGTIGHPLLTNETPVTTWRRGDTDYDGLVDFVDISRVVEGFLGVYGANLSLEMVDQVPDDETTCPPDGYASFKDISETVNAFLQAPPSAVCPTPCP